MMESMKKLQLYFTLQITQQPTRVQRTHKASMEQTLYLEQFLCVSEPTEAAAHLSDSVFVSSV